MACKPPAAPAKPETGGTFSLKEPKSAQVSCSMLASPGLARQTAARGRWMVSAPARERRPGSDLGNAAWQRAFASHSADRRVLGVEVKNRRSPAVQLLLRAASF